VPPLDPRPLPSTLKKRTVVMDTEGKKSGWTPRRVVRWAGTATIVTALFMAVIGAYGFGEDVTPRFLYIYWTIFFLFLMGAVCLAMIDAMITIAKFKKEHRDLRELARKAIRDGIDANHTEANSTHER
jgi:hypothetical protein